MSGLSLVLVFKEAKVETKCSYLLMFCLFLIPSYKEIVFLCGRELWTIEVVACPLTSIIHAIVLSDAFITVMIPPGVSPSSLNHFWFSPLGTKLQALFVFVASYMKCVLIIQIFYPLFCFKEVSNHSLFLFK